MDFVHSKRRNNLKPETLEKFVYIHWNMQLLHVAKNIGANDEGYVDLWSSFFEAIPEPDENDGSILKGLGDEAEKADEEMVRQSSFVKIPKQRILKKLEDEEDECTDDSDLDDELWKGKCGLSDETSSAEEEEERDSDFELRAQPSVLGSTYVGRREAAGSGERSSPWSLHRSDGKVSPNTILSLTLSSITWTRISSCCCKVLRLMKMRRRPTMQSEAVLKVEEVALQEEGDDRVQPKEAEEADLQEVEHHKEAEEKDQQEDKDDMEQQQDEEMEHEKEDEEVEHEEDE
ncbi:hypothetical protein CBR_g22262 [Chara braunii]|uniref:HAT C-terminal dimerisation domain-containing protein n=1 Tax=Chara braunii TaxID=69332 RepID=A0A388L2G2_CHABU|nr:hypothetical protein CBR_g22262 [Chara braunii]|eukprot:GBG76514.1 hypothetical protein CBR_g22262 [Chara braunii]